MLVASSPPMGSIAAALKPQWRHQASRLFQSELTAHVDVLLSLPSKFFFVASVLTGEAGRDLRRIEHFLMSFVELDFSNPKRPDVNLVSELQEAGFSLPAEIQAEAVTLLMRDVSVLEVSPRVGFAFLLNLINRNKSASDSEGSVDNPALEKREKQNRKLVVALNGAGFMEDADKVERCGQRFRGFVSTKCLCARGVPVRCGNRFCAYCQGKRAQRICKSVERLFKEMRSPKLITLTVPNFDRLTPESIEQIRKIFTRFRHRVSFKRRCRGGFYVFEITYRGKGWNVHIHFLADCDYWPQEELSQEWVASGGGPIVDIRKADAGSVNYVGKYLGKGLDLLDSPDELVELYEAIKGKRLYGAVGDFHGLLSKSGQQAEENCEGFCCQHGNAFEYAGKLTRDEVYQDPTDHFWRVKPAAYLRLRSEFTGWVLHSPKARAPD